MSENALVMCMNGATQIMQESYNMNEDEMRLAFEAHLRDLKERKDN